MSDLLSRMVLAFRAGLQFGGNRDLYAVYGYNSKPVFKDYLARYVRQDIAKRIVNAPASATWKTPPEVTGNASFDTAWKELVKQYKVWNVLERLDRLTGIGQYAVLLIGLTGNSNLIKPVSGKSSVLYFQPYSEGSATIKKYDDQSTSPRFGLPLSYELKVSDASLGGFKSKEVTVHYTRVVHVAEDCLENTVFGIPRLQGVYNLLDDLAKVVGGSAETYWLMSNRGMQVDVDKDMDLSTSDAKALSTEIEEYHHQLRRFIRTRGVKINNLGSDIANPKDTFEVLMALVSGTTGIPKRILLGSEIGQLASAQDRANWADRVEERRTNFVEPAILSPFIDTLIAAKVLPESDYSIKWPVAFKMTPLEETQKMAQFARAATNLSRQYQFGTPVTTQEEARESLGLDPLKGPSYELSPTQTAKTTKTPPTVAPKQITPPEAGVPVTKN